MKKKLSNVICQECGYVFTGHSNMFGKICIQCNSYIPPEDELPIVKENKHSYELMKQKLYEYLKQR